MRGQVDRQSEMLCLISPESRVPEDHPLRRIKKLVDAALKDLSPVFDDMYAELGRPSIPPERLLKAKVLQALYTIRSEKLLIEALDYNLLFRWFLDFNLMEPVRDNSTFTKNQQRLLEHHVAELFFAQVVAMAREQGWASDAHFTVDGTLIDAWAGLKSFQPKDGPKNPFDGDPGNPSVDFHGEKRSNATHQSTTDPESRLARQIDLGDKAPETLGADRGYHNAEMVEYCRDHGIKPHVAMVKGREVEGLDGRITRSPGYRTSQRIRKRIEEVFGWCKETGGLRRTRKRGVARVGLSTMLILTSYNLVRMGKLLGSPPEPQPAPQPAPA